MEENYTPYDQIVNNYTRENAPSDAALSDKSLDTAFQTDKTAYPEENRDSADAFQQNSTIEAPQVEKVSEPVQEDEQENKIPSLSQSLASILSQQQALEEKLCAIIRWQEDQERKAQSFAEQHEKLAARVNALADSISTMSSQYMSSQGPAAMIDSIQKALSRIEKGNLDAIRESKNFQQTLYAKQNKELDSYRSLHANTANASILTEIAHFRNAADDIAGRLDDVQAKNLRIGVVEAIDELLEDNGVEIHQTPVGQRRSLKTCQTRKQVPTGDKLRHGMVARSVTPSFTIGNLVLMKEIVDTYVYDSSLDQQPEVSEQGSAPNPNQVELPSNGQSVSSETQGAFTEMPNEPDEKDPSDEKMIQDESQS